MKNTKVIALVLVGFLLFTSCKIRVKVQSTTDEKEEPKEEIMYKMKNAGKDPFDKNNGAPDLYAGLRRSVYGLPSKNSDDGWWVKSAWDFAYKIKETVPSAEFVEPCIIQIISGYNRDGTTTMGFAKPEGMEITSTSISFNDDNEINHERALSLYDRKGVKAILQFESGNSDVLECLEIAHKKFGHHQSVIGYGIDAEWFFTKESPDQTGIPITDEDTKKWLDRILSYNPSYSLFMKHWEPEHMPPTFRHRNLWFLSDSQIFKSLDEFMDDFTHWDSSFDNSVSGYQYGYPKDRIWWKDISNPPAEIGKRIVNDLPNPKFLFWVDFTANEVDFKNGGLF